MKSLRLLLSAIAVSACAAANASVVTVIPALPGTVSGSFVGSGAETIDFTVPAPYTYTFMLGIAAFEQTFTGVGKATFSDSFTVAPGTDVTYSLTTAVPEIATWVMMFLGFAGLGFAGYRGTRGRTPTFVTS